MSAACRASTPCGRAPTGHWHKTVRRNDEITTEAWLKDIVEHETQFAGRAIQQIYHVDFFNQQGDLVADGRQLVLPHRARPRAREGHQVQGREGARAAPLQPRRSWPTPTSSTPRRRSAAPTPRYWQDVNEGEALPTMLKGPMTVTGFIAYAQGWGGLYIRANKLAWKLIDAHPGLGIANRFGIPDCPERVHWEEEFAHEVGAPGAYDYGPERASWLTHH